MYETQEFEVWNINPDRIVLIGAQKIFNIVGCLKYPNQVENFFYSLNGYPEKLVFFKNQNKTSNRLEKLGDFNIDTIEISQLKPKNRITFRFLRKDSSEAKYHIDFPCRFFKEKLPKFQLNLEGIDYPQQVGQLVNGKWQVRKDEAGESCLEIRKEDSGLDRIILFGRYDWTYSYEITARLCVTSWMSNTHNIGLLFKWNPHLQGDGSWLPLQWSTGLGYYYSQCLGLRLRFGVDVHRDARGKKVGDYILQERPFSVCRYLQGKTLFFCRRCVRLINRNLWQTNYPYSQIVPGRQYRFRLLIHPQKYALTVWKNGNPQPKPQLVAKKPLDRLPQGSVGIIAHRCGVRVYEFNVSPI